MTETNVKDTIKKEIAGKLRHTFGLTPDKAESDEVYQALSLAVRDRIMDSWTDSEQKIEAEGGKRLYYLSAEFLMGRALVNNLINLGIYDDAKEALGEMGFSLDEVEENEPDAGLGNGGLGRLAACFLDSLSTLDMPVTGCCIRYEHGLFRQKIVDGEQIEIDDNWLDDGNIWEIARPDEKAEIRYGGKITENWEDGKLRIEHTDYASVMAYPYDMPVIGYDSKAPATLRLWEARARTELDLSWFNRGDYAKAAEESALAQAISQVLYPEDNHEQGRRLRLKQFYFFAAASIQFMVNRHKETHGDVRTLPDYYTVQINDTHPTLAIPELIRILMDEEMLEWDETIDIVGRLFNYTNHTIMREALERWNEPMFREMLPRIHKIITVIDSKFCDVIWQHWPGDFEKMEDMRIIHGGEIRMANLCIAICGKVNGVSQLHANILKTTTFRDFYVIFPDKFTGITNGITMRRWLAKANEPFTRLIEKRIGLGFLKRYREYSKMAVFAEDQDFLEEFAQMKIDNKIRYRDHIFKTQGIEINENTIFDVQAKRLHEYKRQLLKVMHIMHLYHMIKEGRGEGIAPTTFIFGAKAAPGYYRAKEVIRLIFAVADLVNNDPQVSGVLKVVFIENYGVSEAELLIPATEVSEQLSTAGLEASGTGNMKFMLNGAVTIGTMDGANVEIAEAVGEDNIFIFGARVEEISRLEKDGSYRPEEIYGLDGDIRRILDSFDDGTLRVAKQFTDTKNALIYGGAGSEKPDKYYLLYDFRSYDKVYRGLTDTYADRDKWNRIAVKNALSAGIFSSDRAIEEYDGQIWHISDPSTKPCV
ncbi:MAG: glycogen/starch/alpha-glucan phosphorylase [Clostridiales Family XIII bacterium]|nr:glycogen/starch/alpha-glucan phosphorylase [Clostridiales Family XIII bacterium]